MSRAAGILRPLALLAALLGAAVGALLLPNSGSSVAAGLAVAVLALVVMTVAASVPVASAALPTLRARAALDRIVPRTAQSDPDARGHARPRAPGRLPTAV